MPTATSVFVTRKYIDDWTNEETIVRGMSAWKSNEQHREAVPYLLQDSDMNKRT